MSSGPPLPEYGLYERHGSGVASTTIAGLASAPSGRTGHWESTILKSTKNGPFRQSQPAGSGTAWSISPPALPSRVTIAELQRPVVGSGGDGPVTGM